MRGVWNLCRLWTPAAISAVELLGCDGATPPEPQPTLPVAFTSISATWLHTCALGDDAAIYCFGDNNVGQLGDGTLIRRRIPTRVQSSLRFKAVTTGDGHTCALTEDGVAHCWGNNPHG